MTNIKLRSGSSVVRTSIAGGDVEFNDESSEVGFRDAAEMRAVFSSPDYHRSAWHRARVQEALEANSIMTASDPNAQNGSYQTLTADQFTARETSDAEKAHEAAMIARAERAGIR